MAADGKSEVRFDIPLRDLAVLDAYCHATGKGRTAVLLALLQDWTEAKRYEAMMVCHRRRGQSDGIGVGLRPDSDATPIKPGSARPERAVTREQDFKPEYSPAAVARFPAPERQFYFCGRDYAAACLRTHERRVMHDKGAPPPCRRPRKARRADGDDR